MAGSRGTPGSGRWAGSRTASGLGPALSKRVPWTGERALPMIGARCWCTRCWSSPAVARRAPDIEHLRAVRDLFAGAASDTTVWRTFHELAPDTVAGLWQAMADQQARCGGGNRPDR
ncbi:MAG: hypothetical protein R2699_07655 [Acidimicrobiales bacterium]